jgi:hypothetical protein
LGPNQGESGLLQAAPDQQALVRACLWLGAADQVVAVAAEPGGLLLTQALKQDLVGVVQVTDRQSCWFQTKLAAGTPSVVMLNVAKLRPHNDQALPVE